MNMKNIFQDTRFGDKFLTRDGRLAIYNYHSTAGYHSLIVYGDGKEYRYYDNTNGIINLPIVPKEDVDYSSSVDIVSKLNSWNDNKERDLFFESKDWSMTHYDVILKDGTFAEVVTFNDEDYSGCIYGHMEFTDEILEEKYSVYDDILVWKLKEK